MKKKKEAFERSDDIVYIVMLALVILLAFSPKAESQQPDFSLDPIVREMLRNPDWEADLRDDARKSATPVDPSQPVWTNEGFGGYVTPQPDGSVYYDSIELNNRGYYNYGE